MLKGLIQLRNTREEKRSTKSTSNNKENGNRSIYINNYFKCKWVNAPTKRHRLDEWIQKQDPSIYAVYKKPTSDLKTHID